MLDCCVGFDWLWFVGLLHCFCMFVNCVVCLGYYRFVFVLLIVFSVCVRMYCCFVVLLFVKFVFGLCCGLFLCLWLVVLFVDFCWYSCWFYLVTVVLLIRLWFAFAFAWVMWFCCFAIALVCVIVLRYLHLVCIVVGVWLFNDCLLDFVVC